MTIANKAVVLVAFAVSLLSGCREQPAQTDPNAREAPNAREILSDREGAVPAATPLITLQEAPSFPVDAQNRPFAMIGDSDDRAAAVSDKPVALEEPELRR